MKNGKVLLAVLAGVAAGALIGVLLAPEKGSDTRKKIATAKDDVVDELKNKFNEFLESISGKFESVKEDVMDLVDNEKSKFSEAKSKMEEAKASSK